MVNRLIKRKDEIMVAVVVLMLIVLVVFDNAFFRVDAGTRRSQEIRQCQDRCIEIWSGDGPAVGLADCLAECNPEDYP